MDKLEGKFDMKGFIVLLSFLLCLTSCTYNQSEKGATIQHVTDVQIEANESVAKQGQDVLKNCMYDESNIWESIEQKAQWFEQSQTIHHDLETVHQEFYAFYGQFITDSSFQISRIKFPLLGAIGNCESTLIFDENSWEHLSDDIMKSPDYDRYTYDMVSTDELFFLRFHLKEVGTISEMGFEKINGEWCLTLYWISPC